MTTQSRLLIAYSAIALVLPMLCGCSDSQSDIRLRGSALPLLKVDSGATVVIALARDTIAPSDRAAVEVYYYVVNGPRRTIFDNDPGFYSLHVQTSEGFSAGPTNVTAPITGSLGQTRMSLPARAIFGQVVNLRCIQDGAGYGEGDPAGWGACLGGYSLHEPGSYRIVLEYWGPDFKWQQAKESGGSEIAAADTGAVLEVLPRARHMADTVTLVVR